MSVPGLLLVCEGDADALCRAASDLEDSAQAEAGAPPQLRGALFRDAALRAASRAHPSAAAGRRLLPVHYPPSPKPRGTRHPYRPRTPAEPPWLTPGNSGSITEKSWRRLLRNMIRHIRRTHRAKTMKRRKTLQFLGLGAHTGQCVLPPGADRRYPLGVATPGASRISAEMPRRSSY